ncbi:MAG: prolyl oligopeptidase family serine peptidase [Rubrivivax sp.]
MLQTLCRPLLAGVMLGATMIGTASAQAPGAPTPNDPYLWLEDVTGERALAWVRERNAASEQRLQADPGFANLRTQLREVLDSRAQIPYVTRLGGQLYNFWRDAANPRGLWRRTTLAEYRKAEPAWETVLDIDALGKAEGVNWVWKGSDCLPPAYRRCLLSLSKGGADATVIREFDTVDKRFVDGGFTLPEAKSDANWLDADTLLVGSADSPETSTDSGYARVVKRWQRGTPFSAAKTLFEGEKADVGTWTSVDHTPGYKRVLVQRATGFFSQRSWLLEGDKAVAIEMPEHLRFTFWRERIVFNPRQDWDIGGVKHPGGSLLVADFKAWQRGERKLTPLFVPSATRALSSYVVTRDRLIANVMDNVAGKLEEWTPPTKPGAAWTRRDVKAPYPGTLSITALHDPHVKGDALAEHYWLNAANFLSPDSLSLARAGSDTHEPLKQRPTFFDATGMRAEQRFATSRDGTRVPYFVIWPKGATANGDNPTLLYGYGGFQVSERPFYSGGVGRAWLSKGGVYVLSNIRGGGEFGPAWHQAALREKRQNAFDDYIAIAEDLVKARITQPKRLAIQGGSNGGLLVGAVMLQRPDLFGAVLCQVPLLDMQRYHLLLAGASWVAEYGNPDKPEDWAFISKYSPYQRALAVPAGTRLPPMFLVTSTRDDRVHPGHARKMAARLAELGQPVTYWENIEGGHGGAADNGQRAQMQALGWTFLWQAVGGAPTTAAGSGASPAPAASAPGR